MTNANAVGRHLLVDYENVHEVNLGALAEDFQVTIFVGHSQNSLPFNLVRSAQRLGTRLIWFKADANGNNALDFHIAYSLGCLLTGAPQLEVFILSKDTGYDPLVRYLVNKGRKVRRIASFQEIALLAAAPPAPAPNAPPTPAPKLAHADVPKTPPVTPPKAPPSEAPKAPAQPPDPQYGRVLELLGKSPKNARPRKRTTLSQHIANMFQMKLKDHEVKRLVDLLFANGKIAEANKVLTYRF